MKSLFDPSVNREVIDRIQKLNPNSKPVWGKMTVAQMVTHSQRPFQVANEELQLKRGLIGILFGNIARKQLFKPEDFKKNLPTDKNFKITSQPDFEKEKNNLINYIQRFAQVGPKGITKEPHPFFGKLSVDEWDMLLYKHLDHHLKQFSV